jgi:hypothetical protein
VRLWDKWNRTEGGYEWLDISQILAFISVIAVFAVVILGVVWTK